VILTKRYATNTSIGTYSLYESLINYGFESGAVVPLQTGMSEPKGVPVWELDGALKYPDIFLLSNDAMLSDAESRNLCWPRVFGPPT